jgi:hypothetical protein
VNLQFFRSEQDLLQQINTFLAMDYECQFDEPLSPLVIEQLMTKCCKIGMTTQALEEALHHAQESSQSFKQQKLDKPTYLNVVAAVDYAQKLHSDVLRPVHNFC